MAAPLLAALAESLPSRDGWGAMLLRFPRLFGEAVDLCGFREPNCWVEVARDELRELLPVLPQQHPHRAEYGASLVAADAYAVEEALRFWREDLEASLGTLYSLAVELDSGAGRRPMRLLRRLADAALEHLRAHLAARPAEGGS